MRLTRTIGLILVTWAMLSGAAAADLRVLTTGAYKPVLMFGPIPAEIQNYTAYAGAVGTGAREPMVAQALLTLLSSAQAQAVLKEKGMQVPQESK